MQGKGFECTTFNAYQLQIDSLGLIYLVNESVKGTPNLINYLLNSWGIT